ncbi:hypothetical protein GCM10010300_61190 [Streptomyces olivaceoviridis]|nr:hypothetical protein GCM10010300_61190 [Streptomyces olivaceoviridis]
MGLLGRPAADARAARRQPGEPGDPPSLWAGVGLVRGGAGTALVGGHEEVAERIKEYHALGIDEFVLSGYPHLEGAYWLSEGVLPRLPGPGPVAAPVWTAGRSLGPGALRRRREPVRPRFPLGVPRGAMSSEGSGGRTVEPVIKEDFGCAA